MKGDVIKLKVDVFVNVENGMLGLVLVIFKVGEIKLNICIYICCNWFKWFFSNFNFFVWNNNFSFVIFVWVFVWYKWIC